MIFSISFFNFQCIPTYTVTLRKSYFPGKANVLLKMIHQQMKHLLLSMRTLMVCSPLLLWRSFFVTSIVWRQGHLTILMWHVCAAFVHNHQAFLRREEKVIWALLPAFLLCFFWWELKSTQKFEILGKYQVNKEDGWLPKFWKKKSWETNNSLLCQIHSMSIKFIPWIKDIYRDTDNVKFIRNRIYTSITVK